MTFMPAEFVDTNILVYAYDQTAGQKHETAFVILCRGNSVPTPPLSLGRRTLGSAWSYSFLMNPFLSSSATKLVSTNSSGLWLRIAGFLDATIS